MSYAERIAALAGGRYGDGLPAQPVSVGPFAADPLEALVDIPVEAVAADPRAAASTPMSQGPDLGWDSEQVPADPAAETAGIQRAGDLGGATKDPDAASTQLYQRPEAGPDSRRVRADEGSELSAGAPGDARSSQDKAEAVAGNPPYLSYAEALLQMPVARGVNGDAQAAAQNAESVEAEPGAQIHEEGHLIAPKIETLSEPQLSHEMGTPGGGEQVSEGGLEIGELTISVVAPEPTRPPSVRPRGVPISPGAALRRAGIRRL